MDATLPPKTPVFSDALNEYLTHPGSFRVCANCQISGKLYSLSCAQDGGVVNCVDQWTSTVGTEMYRFMLDWAEFSAFIRGGLDGSAVKALAVRVITHVRHSVIVQFSPAVILGNAEPTWVVMFSVCNNDRKSDDTIVVSIPVNTTLLKHLLDEDDSGEEKKQ